MRIKNIAFCWSALCLFGCEVIEYHPYDARFEGETALTQKNISLIEEKMKGKSEFRFAVIADTQRRYDETENLVNDINRRDDIEFVLHVGDLADFGETKEFVWAREALNRLKVPYVCLLGNHDCLGTGFEVYRKMFGPENFAFTAGDVRFVCLNTNALEFDYSLPVPNFSYMEQEMKAFPEEARKTVVAMHVPPGDLQFNNNVVKAFGTYVSRFPNVQFCVYGHVHSFGETEFFDDGIVYYACAGACKEAYYVITIKEEGYEVERCYL